MDFFCWIFGIILCGGVSALKGFRAGVASRCWLSLALHPNSRWPQSSMLRQHSHIEEAKMHCPYSVIVPWFGLGGVRIHSVYRCSVCSNRSFSWSNCPKKSKFLQNIPDCFISICPPSEANCPYEAANLIPELIASSLCMQRLGSSVLTLCKCNRIWV